MYHYLDVLLRRAPFANSQSFQKMQTTTNSNVKWWFSVFSSNITIVRLNLSFQHLSILFLYIFSLQVDIWNEVDISSQHLYILLYFAMPWIRPWANMAETSLFHVHGHDHFIPSTFREHPLSSSVVKAEYVFPYINFLYGKPPLLSPK